ncbi:MAG: hypothetical protein A3A43_03585 [Candidatus Liptonbacteria bacterium RIFCSPLOWO2_01_FULL_56_20]|uniref:Transcriptional repressor PaaX-like central Cas2-like domain-containing protein n=1 Tax=Candidatus Liptonbacteria bacterium RIFCSPLOWO2_01_FULL_56_20 TaxID=1798652 RepID=A0A1G2CLN8_9BACT|nr:MAG: hypothetical protein A2681_02490 [Candidatus Liptonbacteria bacterium RIFCSPHIGHO2_01_FULL_56_18b]OGZ01338.1 MAG: hypothetical protein A3A43_03585 [Candidatus Liptonbacteria bacterium RIFCSPLOWO2_01_FULL_56_20]
MKLNKTCDRKVCYISRMSLVDDLLVILSSYSQGYRLMRARGRGSVRRPEVRRMERFAHASEATIQVTLSRLKKKGLVQGSGGIWKITAAGLLHVRRKQHAPPAHSRKSHAMGPKNMIIAFDIPEKDKRKRNWLRIELVCLGFEMLQKSVWFGPAPLPQAFIASLEKLRIIPFVKFFEVREADII